ncbi:MAG: hypothetical protein DI626_00785 [Micavibrio aeruginosavorus]|uniref:HAD family hydrolase n=1 Tax=Micavibrio aeruginosavorus TaxID=349221 RepID=A0A2W5A2S8_9BACT|nr:MAG: hypothetical protein DI626_00785 [Micavibrio aeruginosavorus]
MKQALTAERDIVIFDCDGVFYSWRHYAKGASDTVPSDPMHHAKRFCAEVKADVVPLLLPVLTRDEAAILGKRSYEETGDGLRYFVELATQHGFDANEFREQLHIAYHQLQFKRITESYPEVLAPCLESGQHMQALASGGVNFGVLSQSCRDNWLKPLLGSKNILNHIKPEHLFGFKEFGWNEKSINAKGLGIIMDVMEADPSRVVFVEDTKKNLYPVKAEYPDVLTVHINDWHMPTPEDDYIDVAVDTTLDYMRLHRAARVPQPAVKAQPRPMSLTL